MFQKLIEVVFRDEIQMKRFSMLSKKYAREHVAYLDHVYLLITYLFIDLAVVF